MKTTSKLLLAMVLAAGAGACGPQVITPAGPRVPSLVADVEIYQQQPSKYEKLGEVTLVITPDYHWDEKGDAAPAFDRLKMEAAALGANGLLLMDDQPGKDIVQVGAGYAGSYYLVPLRKEPRTAVAQAIYVLSK